MQLGPLTSAQCQPNKQASKTITVRHGEGHLRDAFFALRVRDSNNVRSELLASSLSVDNIRTTIFICEDSGVGSDCLMQRRRFPATEVVVRTRIVLK